MGRAWVRLVGAVLTVAALGACTAAGPTDAPTSAAATPQVTQTVQLGPRTIDLTIQSPAVGSSVAVRLILPTRYAAEPNRRFPVLYLLHGATGTHEDWTDHTDIGDLSKDADLIVAMPFGGPAGFYSDWLKGPRWETFHTVELPAILAASYRASDRAAVAGLSMGGLGALAYAARHPGQYAAAASFSGVVHTRLSSGVSYGYRNLVQSQGEDPNGLWGDMDANADVWAAHNPYDLAPKLKGVPLFVSCGNGLPGPLDVQNAPADGNENAVNEQNQPFVKHLKELGVDAEVDLYGPGTHSWPYWQRELHQAWPMIAKALGV
jgi:diacylglycerol O-acyltransferase / trehalose O-mycolyltransferase